MRARVTELRPLVAKGLDPIEERKKDQAPDPIQPQSKETFRKFAEGYVAGRSRDWRNEKHAEQWRSTLERYVYPVIGDMALDEIDTPDVLRILEPIWQTKRETATRVRGRIESILAAAAVRGKRPATNPAAWAGHLKESGLARKRPAIKHFEALDYHSMPAFMEALRKRDHVSARALEFIILTAARSGEGRALGGGRRVRTDMDHPRRANEGRPGACCSVVGQGNGDTAGNEAAPRS